MNLPFIFTSGIVVAILFLIGLIYTFREFKEMDRHPEDYTRHNDAASVSHKDKKTEK